MLINWNNILTVLSLKDALPEEAKPFLKEYCGINSVLISRKGYDDGILFEVTDADIEYRNYSDTELINKSNHLFKKIIMQYGHYRNTKTAA